MKYKVQKIEQNYNQIWHGIKANKTHSCKLQFYIFERPKLAILAWKFSLNNMFVVFHKNNIEYYIHCLTIKA